MTEQTRFEAQHQREECLTTVVVNLFTMLEYNYLVQPPFIGELSPDILVEKNGDKVIVELKAYTKKMVCAEPEFAQNHPVRAVAGTMGIIQKFASSSSAQAT